jgi:hypothetical protein
MTTCSKCESTNGYILQGSGSNVRARKCDHKVVVERRWWDDVDSGPRCLTCRGELPEGERKFCSPECRLEYRRKEQR